MRRQIISTPGRKRHFYPQCFKSQRSKGVLPPLLKSFKHITQYCPRCCWTNVSLGALLLLNCEHFRLCRQRLRQYLFYKRRQVVTQPNAKIPSCQKGLIEYSNCHGQQINCHKNVTKIIGVFVDKKLGYVVLLNVHIILIRLDSFDEKVTEDVLRWNWECS